MLSITPHRATYEENDSSVYLSRPGYLTFDFIPVDNTEGSYRGNYNDRNTFIMTLKNIGDFLKIDDTYKTTTDSDNDSHLPPEPVLLNYNSRSESSSQQTSVLKIEKKLAQDDESDSKIMYFELTYMLIRNEEIIDSSTIMIEQGEMVAIQALLEHSLFYLLGWQVLGTPQILDNDLGYEQGYKKNRDSDFSPFGKKN